MRLRLWKVREAYNSNENFGQATPVSDWLKVHPQVRDNFSN